MALIKRKTGKKISDQVSKAVKDHPKIAAGVAATGLVAGLLTLVGKRKGKSASTKKSGDKGKKVSSANKAPKSVPAKKAARKS